MAQHGPTGSAEQGHKEGPNKVRSEWSDKGPKVPKEGPKKDLKAKLEALGPRPISKSDPPIYKALKRKHCTVFSFASFIDVARDME